MNRTALYIELERGRAFRRGSPGIKVCRGDAKGCTGERDMQRCPDCLHVDQHDPRSSTQILEHLERGDA